MLTYFKCKMNIAVLTAVSVWGVGCMVGPDYHRPETTAEETEQFVNRSEIASDCNDFAEVGQWWKRFSDPVTDELVTEALAGNTDLKAAAARLLQAEAVLAEVKGAGWPQIFYGFSRNRSKMSFNSPFGERRSFLSTTYSQDISVSYVADLFGKLKRSERAAWAEMLAAEANRMTLRHTIIAEVVRMRAQIATLQKLSAIAKSNTDNWRMSLEVVDRRYSRGLTRPLDVRMARENLAASEAAEIRLERLIATAELGLDALVGRRPGSSKSLPETLAELPDPEPIPIGVPAGLLDRRPDIMVAEMRLMAATERVGVKIAQLYPDLTLTGSAGFRSDSLSEIFSNEGQVYSLLIQIMQPIFRGGQLQSQIDGAKAKVEEETANYAGAILHALREVEEALIQERLLRRQMAALETRLNEARAALDLAQRRYLRGVNSVMVVLETERRKRIAENELAAIKGDIWSARIDLFLALGGDWEAESEG